MGALCREWPLGSRHRAPRPASSPRGTAGGQQAGTERTVQGLKEGLSEGNISLNEEGKKEGEDVQPTAHHLAQAQMRKTHQSTSVPPSASTVLPHRVGWKFRLGQLLGDFISTKHLLLGFMNLISPWRGRCLGVQGPQQSATCWVA